MPTQHSAADLARYLIHARNDVALKDFLASLASDHEIVLLDVIGPQDSPHTVVICTSAAKARTLAQRFAAGANQLTIEPDQPLALE